MPLSHNDIRARAAAFAHERADAYDEDAEAKSFWDGFFRVFGQERRQVAMFEKYVRKLDDKQGFIDLFWPGKLMVEHKSKGKNLDRAFSQATDYFELFGRKQDFYATWYGIDISNLPKGIYQLRISKNEGMTFVFKIIKQ